MSPQVHKKYTTPANRTSFQLRYSEPFDSGALSDESLEMSGCFFKVMLPVLKNLFLHDFTNIIPDISTPQQLLVRRLNYVYIFSYRQFLPLSLLSTFF